MFQTYLLMAAYLLWRRHQKTDRPYCEFLDAPLPGENNLALWLSEWDQWDQTKPYHQAHRCRSNCLWHDKRATMSV